MAFFNTISETVKTWSREKKLAERRTAWVTMFVIIIAIGLLAVNKFGINPRRPPKPWGEFTEQGWSNKLVVPATTQITDDQMALLADPKLEHITFVSMHGQRGITSVGFRHLSHLKKLRRVMLNDCAVTDGALDALGSLPELELLNLTGNKITGEGLGQLKNRILLYLMGGHCSDFRPST